MSFPVSTRRFVRAKLSAAVIAAVATLGAMPLGQPSALAVTSSWSTAGSGNWSGANWSVQPPVLGASDFTAQFNQASGTITASVDPIGVTSLNGLVLGNTASAYTIDQLTANTFLRFVNDGATAPTITLAGSGTQTLGTTATNNLPIILANNTTITGTGTGKLVINAPLMGTGTLGISSGKVRLNNALSGAALSLSGGTLIVSSTGETGHATLNITSGTITNDVDTGINVTIWNPVTIDGSLSFTTIGARAVNFGNVMAIGASGATISNTSGKDVTVAAVKGAGALTSTGANAFSLTTPASLFGGVNYGYTGTLVVATGGFLYLATNATTTQNNLAITGGTVRITGVGPQTVTVGNLGGTGTLDGSNDPTVNIVNNATSSFAGNITTNDGNTLTLVKWGNFTQTLVGTLSSRSFGANGNLTVRGGTFDLQGSLTPGNTASAGVNVSGGSLVINDNGGGAANANRMINSAFITLGGTVGGGTFEYLGRDATASTETTATTAAGVLTLNSGHNIIKTTNGATGGTATLTLGDNTTAAARTSGATLDLTGTGTTVLNFTNTPASTRLGGWATYASNDWAVTNGANQAAAFAGYVNKSDVSTWIASDDVNVNAAPSNTLGAPLTINSLRIDSAGTINLGTNALTVATPGFSTTVGGILQTSSVTGTTVISNGTLTAGAELVFTVNAGTLQLDAGVTGTGLVVTKTGAGTLIFNGANTFGPAAATGATSYLVVNQGTVQLAGNEKITNNGSVTVNKGGTLDLNGFTETIQSLTIRAGTVTVGNGALLLTDNNSGRGLLMTGGEINTGATGIIRLGGRIQSTAGSADTAFIKGALAIDLVSGVGSRTVNIADGPALVDLDIQALLQNGNSTVVGGATINNNAGLTLAGAGTVKLSNTGNSFGGSTGSNVILSSGGRLIVSADGNLGASTTGAAAQFNTSGTATLDLQSANGTDASGFSARTINTNHASGNGIIILNRDSAGAALAYTFGTWNSGTGSGTLYVIPGANVTSGTPSLKFNTANLNSTNKKVEIADGALLEFGTITNGSSGLTKNGAGTLVLSGSATSLAGTISVASGALNLQNATAAGTAAISVSAASASALNNSGASLQLQGSGAISNNVTIAGFGARNSGGALRNISGSNSLSSTLTVTGNAAIQSDAGSLTLAGVTGGTGTLYLQGAGNGVVGGAISGANTSLAKFGAGTWELSGTSNYAGSTTVNEGTLKVSGSITGVGAVSVNTSGTLTGTGSINASAVSIASGGTLTPGISGAGTLTLNGTLSLAGTAQFTTAASTVNTLVTGITGFSYGGTLKVAASDFTSGNTWDLFNFTSQSGAFANNAVFGTAGDGTNLPTLSGGKTWTFDYTTGILSIASGGTPASATVALTGPAAGGRVIVSQNLIGAVTGTVANSGAATVNLNVALSSIGSLTASSLTPVSATVAPGASTNFTGDLATGVATGSQTVQVRNTDGAASPTTADSASVSLTVLANRTFTASTLGSLGLQHQGFTITPTNTTVTVDGNLDSQATRINISGGTDGNLTVAGSATAFNSAGQNEPRGVTGTLNTAGPITGSITLSTSLDGSETATGATSQNANVTYTASVFNGTGVWTAASSGNWGTHANWTDSNGINAAPGTFAGFDNVDTANFDGTGAGTTATIAAPGVSVKNVNFSGATGYTIAQTGGNVLTMKANAGSAAIAASGTASHTISAPIVLASNTNVSAAGNASLAFSGGIDNSAGLNLNLSNTSTGTLGGGSITNTGTVTVSTGSVALASGTSPSLVGPITLAAAGEIFGGTPASTAVSGVTTVSQNATLAVSRIRQDTLNIHGSAGNDAATVSIAPSAPAATSYAPGDNHYVSVVKSLNIDHSGTTYYGTLDLGNNDIIVDYTGASPASQLEEAIRSGYNGGAWNGKGIIMNAAYATTGSYAIDIVDNATLGASSFDGIAIDADTVIIKFTWVADLNIDGFVTAADASVFGTNYSAGSATSRFFGDLNYNGSFDAGDASIFGTSYDASLPSLPEPASLGLLAIGAIGLLARRRK